jgi:hypothetical protein
VIEKGGRHLLPSAGIPSATALRRPTGKFRKFGDREVDTTRRVGASPPALGSRFP